MLFGSCSLKMSFTPKWLPHNSCAHRSSKDIVSTTTARSGAIHNSSSVQRQQKPWWREMAPTGCGRRAGGIVPGRMGQGAERMGGQETENTRRIELRERRVWLTRIQLNRENGTGVTLGDIVWPTLCRQWAAFYVILLLRIPSCVFSGKLLNLSVPQVFSSVKSE